MTMCRRRGGLFRVSLGDFGHCPLQARRVVLASHSEFQKIEIRIKLENGSQCREIQVVSLHGSELMVDLRVVPFGSQNLQIAPQSFVANRPTNKAKHHSKDAV